MPGAAFFKNVIRRIPRPLFVAAAILIAIAGIWFFFFRGTANSSETIIVHPADFVQQVSVSGTVKPAQDVDLGFQQSGRVSGVYASVGKTVPAGTVLVAIESGDIAATVAEKQAALQSEQAKLAGLKAGAQPADIAASQAAVDKSRQDLANMYAGISDTLADAFAKGTDAVRTQLNSLFSNADTTNPQLTYSTGDSQSVNDTLTARVQSGIVLNSWQQELASITSSSGTSVLEGAITSGLSHLAVVHSLLQDVITTLNTNTNLSATTLAAYKTSAATALSEVNTAISNLNDTSQKIASQKIAVQQLQSQLDLKRAGATPEDLAAQQAQVAVAQASLENAQAQAAKTRITAPFSGVVTKVDAKVGEIVSPNTPEVSMISTGAFQIESYIPEVNIALVAVGNPAAVTLDAYGENVPFSAQVVSIDPAETLQDGVSTYRAVLQFTTQDPRIKSGMTANIVITTERKSNVIAVPQGVIITRGGKKFVPVKSGDTTAEREVTTGEISSLGLIEILSGLSDGDTVVVSAPAQ